VYVKLHRLNFTYRIRVDLGDRGSGIGRRKGRYWLSISATRIDLRSILDQLGIDHGEIIQHPLKAGSNLTLLHLLDSGRHATGEHLSLVDQDTDGHREFPRLDRSIGDDLLEALDSHRCHLQCTGT
jgi:hypothetical protein